MSRSFEFLLGGPAQRRDIVALYEIRRIEEGKPLDETSLEALNFLLVDAASGRVYMAVVEAVPAGIISVFFRQSVTWGGRIAVIEDFFLLPEFRGRRLAHRFLRSALGDLEAFGTDVVLAYLDPDDPYCRLYELEAFARKRFIGFASEGCADEFGVRGANL